MAIYVDAHFWIALFSKKDQWHERALSYRELFESEDIVTSELSLTEVLDGFAKRGGHLRKAVVKVIEEVRKRPGAKVVPMSAEQFASALDLYKNREDKTWGLTDCACMQIMDEMGIRRVLTGDDDFAEAGLEVLS